jgi:hypothetical protein
MSDVKQRALITGASSGIGAATAWLLAKEKEAVILVARRVDRLKQLAESIQAAGGEAHVLPADLTQENERHEVIWQATQGGKPVDILINNAGFGWYGYGEQMPWSIAQSMLQVNIAAVTQLTLALLPGMKQRNRGHIVNVGSIAGGFPNQGVALYSATKAFLDSFSTALYRELHNTQVNVSVIRSGAVSSEFFDLAKERSTGRRIPFSQIAVKPEMVAQRIWSVIRHPVRYAYVPRLLRIIPWIELSFGWLIDRMGPLLLPPDKSASS